VKYLSIKNFSVYQHYKDRRPPWIKLHTSMLDDYEFVMLPDATKCHLMLLWVLASQMDNKLPHDLVFLTGRIHASSPIDLEELILRGFLEPYEGEKAKGRREDWSSRHVSAQLRATLLSDSKHTCVACGAQKNLEIDHIIPISQGGSGDPQNLQVLCRPCNRRKRARLTYPSAQPQRSKLLRSSPDSALLETETETETEPRKKANPERYAFMGVLRPIWKEKYGGDMPEGAARDLAPLNEELGTDVLARRFRNYVAVTAASFVSVPKFKQTHGTWDRDGQVLPLDKAARDAAHYKKMGYAV
jgi:5-methylcytosine-specific restriction endonuclease McrA